MGANRWVGLTPTLRFRVVGESVGLLARDEVVAGALESHARWVEISGFEHVKSDEALAQGGHRLER